MTDNVRSYGLVEELLKTKKRAMKRRKTPVAKRIEQELERWGINKKTVGPILLPILITLILHQLNVGFSLGSESKYTEEDVRVKDIIEELYESKSKRGIAGRLPRRALEGALRAIVKPDGVLSQYTSDDVPEDLPMTDRDIELFEFLASHKK